MHSTPNYMPFLMLFFMLACTKEPTSETEGAALSSAITQNVFIKTNALRAEKGLAAYKRNEEMDVLGQLHSDNMVEHDFFAHEDHQGASPSDRADALNYSWTTIAENIGYVPWFENVDSCGDTRSAEAIAECMMDGWINSPGHYANLIGNFEQIGIGVTFTRDSILYFTQVFRNP